MPDSLTAMSLHRRLLAVLVALGVLAAGCGSTLVADDRIVDGDRSATPVATEPGEAPDPDTPTATSAPRFSDLPTVGLGELPIEALETLDLIAVDGPYPYRKDGSTFQNREGILPDRDLGHYREFTVDTPGSSDRGARRIVAGDDGERYYTDDHYASFREILQ